MTPIPLPQPKPLEYITMCLGSVMPRDDYCKECIPDCYQKIHYCYMPVNLRPGRDLIQMINEIEGQK